MGSSVPCLARNLRHFSHGPGSEGFVSRVPPPKHTDCCLAPDFTGLIPAGYEAAPVGGITARVSNLNEQGVHRVPSSNFTEKVIINKPPIRF